SWHRGRPCFASVGLCGYASCRCRAGAPCIYCRFGICSRIRMARAVGLRSLRQTRRRRLGDCDGDFWIHDAGPQPPVGGSRRLVGDTVQKSPQKPRAHINLGQVYQEGGRLMDALREYQIAAQLKPNLANANLNIGLTYMELGELERAKSVFERMRETSPE